VSILEDLMAEVVDQYGKVWPSQAAYFGAQNERIGIKPALTQAEAKAQGYTNWTEHLASLPCPAQGREDVYCATCMGPLGQLAQKRHR
jgi:hypothetical protein